MNLSRLFPNSKERPSLTSEGEKRLGIEPIGLSFSSNEADSYRLDSLYSFHCERSSLLSDVIRRGQEGYYTNGLRSSCHESL